MQLFKRSWMLGPIKTLRRGGGKLFGAFLNLELNRPNRLKATDRPIMGAKKSHVSQIVLEGQDGYQTSGPPYVPILRSIITILDARALKVS